MQIWVMLIKKQKRIREMVIKGPEDEDTPREQLFEEALQQALPPMDLPRPVVLQKHLREFMEFGRTHFYEADFVESLPGDSLVIELLIEKKKN